MWKVLRCEELAAGAGYHLKAEAARSEWEEDGASDLEAPFCLVGRREATDHSCRWS
ncbi:hypothetical protein [Bacillus cereus]|uniref:hypothetical protein n=1 Tax=Bacillus cereus TaxID=1396 RepID=UPI0020D21A73